ncbi:MAG: efflux RND transporter periplasmic adaptor subunit [Brevundimonas sp.]|jgi:HlyD family secretion protein|uniref:Efflux RND transporter periplasmic adaptor subunit n=1 Tax=Brevundimonas olei TaxID=657642 RepID=A0ABZ2IIQ9_9CAUL|nr:efflux RND transporter periplasmic adaptor subunit [Brevundimonas sp.]MCH4268594.1 efflux RND transporter periplasmic adaptor subunit [Brevundimonas sp.]
MPAFLKNKWLWIGLALLVVLIIGFGMMQKAGAAKKAELAEAAEKKVESPYSAIANGKIDIEGGIIQIAARRGGVVREVLVQEGDLVKAGQILARQEDDEPRLALQTASATLAEAESQLRLINVDIAAAQREYDRLQKLVATNFVAAQRMDQARDAIAQAQARLGSQQSAVQSARARRDQAAYDVELTVIRSPADGRIVRRYANPGAGASTLNVSNMFDLEPAAPRIARAEIVEADIPNVAVDQAVEITPEGDPSKVYVGKVLRRAAVFGARKLASDDPSQRTDERVVEVVVAVDDAPLLIGQRVLVKFMKPGETAGAKRDNASTGVPAARAMKAPART